MGSAHVGQIDVVVAGMIPVANVEAKVRHAAALVALNNLTQSMAVCSLGCRLPPETRTPVFYWRKARISKRSYVVEAAVCTENSNPDVMMVKPAEDQV
jgi:hypothetical protein